MECTQQSQIEEAPTPLSPLPPMPWGRLVPCVPSVDNGPIELMAGQNEYWLGRSLQGIQVKPGRSETGDEKENVLLSWAHSTISNRHCSITQIGSPPQTSSSQSSMPPSSPKFTPSGPQVVLEDNSGNGTFVNQTVHLAKGHQRILHSGDEICLINPQNLRKKTISGSLLRKVMQQYTYVLVLSNKAKRGPCVNPRAMNYSGRSKDTLPSGAASPRSARRIEAHYEIREILGDGTSGQVRRAIHRQSGKEYAVKVISLRQQIDLASMEQEVTVMQSLDHPYVVQLVDVFVHHGIAMYLVMELVSGGDLFDRIVQKERYSEVDARRVMRRLLSAIHYLHQTKNIVHRDLKPENILCTSPTSVKLADFGLAKMIQSDGLKTFCGTPQYFAPEVLQRRTTVAGSGRYGKPADMWSLGVILYILLVGRPPFEADLDPLQAFHALDFEDELWKAMPQAQDLVECMLRLDPKRRLTVRQACDHPWINIEDGDTHIHPLDDPAVTGRKRLFSETGDNKQSVMASKEPLIEDETSVSSKESSLSKAEFSAAANSHQRVESVDYLDIKDELEKADPGFDASMADVVDEHIDMDLDTPAKQKEEVDSGKDGDNVKTAVDSSPSPDTELKRELSVTPSEFGDDDVPRSPLAAMNLNERSNRFRAQVLKQQNNNSDEQTMQHSPSRPETEKSQVAVTPTASNVRPSASAGGDACNDFADVEEDPILSQFSSEPSSLESFPDSPEKEHSPSALAKNPPEVEANSVAGTGKRKRAEKSGDQKHIVQKKLSDWFVAKKPKVGANKGN